MARHRSGAWPRVARDAYRRDRDAGAPCWICHQPIDYLAPSGTPDAYEPDHVLPVADYPEYELDLENVAPAHMSCNRSRGNRNNAGDLGQQSRIW